MSRNSSIDPNETEEVSRGVVPLAYTQMRLGGGACGVAFDHAGKGPVRGGRMKSPGGYRRGWEGGSLLASVRPDLSRDWPIGELKSLDKAIPVGETNQIQLYFKMISLYSARIICDLSSRLL
jgi:hypothetical protein